MRKIIGIIVVGLLISTISTSIGTYEKQDNLNSSIEVVDQENRGSEFFMEMFENKYHAQGFTPAHSPLTKISAQIGRYGNPPENAILTISIREILTGDDLVSKQFEMDNINNNKIDFDFPDIDVTIGEKYFIVAIVDKGDIPSDCYYWAYSHHDTYEYGDAWYSTNGINWDDASNHIYEDFPDIDFVFTTYWKDFCPDNPTIDGPQEGKSQERYGYTISTNDFEGNEVEYQIDWGDGITTSWYGPYKSGEEVEKEHQWANEGNYTIRVKARDVYGAESEWTSMEITMPKAKIYSNRFLEILKNYTRLFRKDPPASWLEGSDQVQTTCGDYGFIVNPDFSCAQEFKPSEGTLTAVALPFFKFGSPPAGTTITVGIRTELEGIDLTTISISTNDWRINNRKPTWILFDFDDIEVTPEESYYIYCVADKGVVDLDDSNNTHVFCWNFEFDNKYPRGIAFQSNDSGWYDLENYFDDPEYVQCDFGFITYYQEPKSKTIFNLFLRFLDIHPRLFPVIRLLLT